jgi:hypothetical protein
MAESFEEALIIFSSCFSGPEIKHLRVDSTILITAIKAGKLGSLEERYLPMAKNMAKQAIEYLVTQNIVALEQLKPLNTLLQTPNSEIHQ